MTGNVDIVPFEIETSSFCSLTAGTVVKEINYSGKSETFITPCNGIYKIEVYGAGGSSGGYTNGKNGGSSTFWGASGGYAVGNINLLENQELTVTVGGSNGYNGGATGSGTTMDSSGGYFAGGWMQGGTGGGSTDIRMNGTEIKDRILVAGGGAGGGGSLFCNSLAHNEYSTSNPKSNGVLLYGTKGTSTSSLSTYNSYPYSWVTGGAGGGYYGGVNTNSGGASTELTYSGTSYVDETKFTDGSTAYGKRGGNGYARITIVSLGN